MIFSYYIIFLLPKPRSPIFIFAIAKIKMGSKRFFEEMGDPSSPFGLRRDNLGEW